MKNIVFLLLLLFASSTLFAQTPVESFEQLMTALKAGKSVKAVIHYGQCKLFSDGKEQAESPDAIGGMELNTY